MRKATWGTVALGVWAFSLGSPVRELATLHRILGLLLMVGYILLSLDPPERSKRQRDLFIAGIVASIASFLLAFLDLPPSANVLSRLLAVAVAALPLWLVAGPARAGFIAAGVLAAVTLVPALEQAGGVATSTHAYVLALSCFAVALMFERPSLFLKGEKRPPRVVVGRDVVFLTPEQKAARLAKLEKRFQDGEIPEHKYWDLRQEIESR